MPRSVGHPPHCTPGSWVTEFLLQVTKFKWRQYRCPKAQTRVALINKNSKKFPSLQFPVLGGGPNQGFTQEKGWDSDLADCWSNLLEACCG